MWEITIHLLSCMTNTLINITSVCVCFSFWFYEALSLLEQSHVISRSCHSFCYVLSSTWYCVECLNWNFLCYQTIWHHITEDGNVINHDWVSEISLCITCFSMYCKWLIVLINRKIFHCYELNFCGKLFHVICLCQRIECMLLLLLIHSFGLWLACWFRIPAIFEASSTFLVSLFHDLHLFLVPSILAYHLVFGILSVLMLSVCQYHLNQSDFISFTVSAPCDRSCISIFDFIFQHSYTVSCGWDLDCIVFGTNLFLWDWGVNLITPTWRTRVSFLVWIPTHDLSSFGDPTSGCIAAGIFLYITGSLKPHHHGKAETPWVRWGSRVHKLVKCMFVCAYAYHTLIQWYCG